jgi:transposase
LEGLNYKAIADIVGVDRNAVSNWSEPYRNGVKDLRIDRSKEGFKVPDRSKIGPYSDRVGPL